MDEYGWEEDPPDKDLIRARTKLGQLRLWRFPKGGVKSINGLDFAGPLEHRGLYILYEDTKKQAYIGETSDLKSRLATHYEKGPKELPGWSHAIVISDGRSYAQSIFGSDLRSYLEKRMISHIASGGFYKVINKARAIPKLDVGTKVLAEKLDEELVFVLDKMVLAKFAPIPNVKEEKIPVNELQAVLIKKAHSCRLGEKEGELDESKVYVRPGSKKAKGWQITLRGEFIEAAKKGEGYLIMNRGVGYLVPLGVLKQWLGKLLEATTRDIYVRLDENKVYSTKAVQALDISEFQIK